ncbi:exonuclease domain-containing protein [Amycolatopsis alkalitolerans]|uniref:3'-5' exonuclease n=1 Tax=Amycolatopsis alkalitolerans TaxID=2547244 RepID=A0A5C4M460_9PSEU|nr:exonuclease domain-containing protein [Amycolatopsis alkalitolerans]TNC27397.1 3'-5' exonuclease [Amycolatopsis alkalitolerans]
MVTFGALRLARDGRFPVSGTEFTAVDFRTTGLRPGHVVEMAAVRTRADGTVLAEFTTLVNPGWHVEPGPATLHHVSRRELDNAPEFGDVLGELLDLCSGSVLVAHNLPVTLEFLDAELRRLNVRLPKLPAVGTLDAAREALHLPNAQLATVADALGIKDFPGFLALANARTVAGVVTALTGTHRLAFTEEPRCPQLPQLPVSDLVLPRGAESVPERTWLAELAGRAWVAGDDPVHEAYRELLTAVLSDQYVSSDEVRDLAELAADAGIAVRQTHLDFVAAMRDAAEEEGTPAETEARDLMRIATALGVPEAARSLRTEEIPRIPVRVLVLGEAAGSDALRSAILGAGLELCGELTSSVTHVVVADDVPRNDARLAQARERGLVALDVAAAWTALGLSEPAPVAPGPAVAPRQVWAARALMGAGLLVMLFSLLALVGGAPFAGALVLAVFGVGALCLGWYFSEPGVST